jgi:hypothetical protein
MLLFAGRFRIPEQEAVWTFGVWLWRLYSSW